jgi:hypothetical protein
MSTWKEYCATKSAPCDPCANKNLKDKSCKAPNGKSGVVYDGVRAAPAAKAAASRDPARLQLGRPGSGDLCLDMPKDECAKAKWACKWTEASDRAKAHCGQRSSLEIEGKPRAAKVARDFGEFENKKYFGGVNDCKTKKQPCPTECVSVKPDRCRAKPKQADGYVPKAAKPAAAAVARAEPVEARPKLSFLHGDSICQKLPEKECGVGANKAVCGWVKGYTRSDGVKVKGSCRKEEDRQTHNNVKVKTDMYAHLAAVNAGRNAVDKALRTSFTADELPGLRRKFAAKIEDLAEDEDDEAEVEEEVVAELKRAKSSELAQDPAVQTYVELRSKLTKDDGAVLNEVMTRMHAEVDRITSSGLDSKAEKEALDTLFGKGAKGKEVDLCKFVKGAKGQVTVDELTAIMATLSEKTKVEMPTKVSSTKLRGSMCYIVLSVLMMTPADFVARFTGLNKRK